jgi:hypothetical protein
MDFSTKRVTTLYSSLLHKHKRLCFTAVPWLRLPGFLQVPELSSPPVHASHSNSSRRLNDCSFSTNSNSLLALIINISTDSVVNAFFIVTVLSSNSDVCLFLEPVLINGCYSITSRSLPSDGVQISKYTAEGRGLYIPSPLDLLPSNFLENLCVN